MFDAYLYVCVHAHKQVWLSVEFEDTVKLQLVLHTYQCAAGQLESPLTVELKGSLVEL